MFLSIKSIMAERIEIWKLRNPAIQLCSVGIYARGRAWLKRCLLTRCHAWLGAIHSVRGHTASGFLSWRRKIPYFLMFLLSALTTCRIHFHRTIGFEHCWKSYDRYPHSHPNHSHTHIHTHTCYVMWRWPIAAVIGDSERVLSSLQGRPPHHQLYPLHTAPWDIDCQKLVSSRE